MRIVKHAFGLASAGLFIAFSAIAQPDTVSPSAPAMVNSDSSDLSIIPLVVFALAAIVVYLCNRPRVVVCARARRRTEPSRSTDH